jgi:ABC-2 type transport system permease protein
VLPESLGEVFQYLSVDYHFENIARGVFDTRDILFYLSLTVVGLVLTTRALGTARQ